MKIIIIMIVVMSNDIYGILFLFVLLNVLNVNLFLFIEYSIWVEVYIFELFVDNIDVKMIVFINDVVNVNLVFLNINVNGDVVILLLLFINVLLL